MSPSNFNPESDQPAPAASRAPQQTIFARLTLLVFSLAMLILVALTIAAMGGLSDGRGLVVGLLALFFCLGVGGFVRFRCRIGLRTFLVLVTLMAVCLSFVAKLTMRVRRMNAATEELQSGGAAVHYDLGDTSDWFSTPSGFPLPPWTAQLFGKAAFADVRQVSFFQSTVKSKQMKLLADNFPKVDSLQFYQATIEPGAFRVFEELPLLERLDLTNSSATDGELADLAERAPSLKSMFLAGTQVTPDGLRVVSRFRALDTIHADGALVDDVSIDAIGPQTNLRFLSLVNGTKLTDAGVGMIVQNAPNLDVLTLQGNWAITSDSAVEIVKLKKVRYVNLSSTSIDDRGLLALAKHQELGQLSVSGSKVTAAGVEKFRRLRPNVSIRHSTKARDP